MESSPILQEDDLERLHRYTNRNVFERLYNTPTTASKFGRCSSSSARTPSSSTGDVLIIPAASYSPEKGADSRLRSVQTPDESARGKQNPFSSFSSSNSNSKTYIDSDPGLAELIRATDRESFSPEKTQKSQYPRRVQSNQVSPDFVPAFSAALTTSHTKGKVMNAQREKVRGKSPFAVKRQLFTSETPTRSNRSFQMPHSTQQHKIPEKFPRRGRATPNRLLQKMSPIANERLASEQTKARNEIAASARNGVGKFFDTVDNERISLHEISKVIEELYPDLDCNALALLAYESLHSTRDGLVDATEFQQFVHFLAFFNGVWKDVVYWDHKFGLSVRKKDFVALSQKLGLFDNPLATFTELDTEGRGRILYSQFCTLCASKRIQRKKHNEGDPKSTIPVIGHETKDRGEPSNITQASEVNLLPIQEILSMFDSNYVPTRETVMGLFRRMDVHQSGKLKVSDIAKGFDTMHTASKPLALRVYTSSEWGEKEVFDPASFYVFVLFLVYFNNLWDYFGFSSRKHLRISKRRFIRAASKLGLFDHPEDDYKRMDMNDDGYISFQDFCMVCARRRSEQKYESMRVLEICG